MLQQALLASFFHGQDFMMWPSGYSDEWMIDLLVGVQVDTKATWKETCPLSSFYLKQVF